jgi:hypothetical protein
VTLRLPEDPVDPEHVIQDFVEQHQRHVQLFLVEDFQPEEGMKLGSV